MGKITFSEQFFERKCKNRPTSGKTIFSGQFFEVKPSLRKFLSNFSREYVKKYQLAEKIGQRVHFSTHFSDLKLLNKLESSFTHKLRSFFPFKFEFFDF